MKFDAEEEVMKLIRGAVITTGIYGGMIGIIQNVYWDSPDPIETKLIGFIKNQFGKDWRYILTPYLN